MLIVLGTPRIPASVNYVMTRTFISHTNTHKGHTLIRTHERTFNPLKDIQNSSWLMEWND